MGTCVMLPWHQSLCVLQAFLKNTLSEFWVQLQGCGKGGGRLRSSGDAQHHHGAACWAAPFLLPWPQPVIWESWVTFLALPTLDSLSCHNYAGSLRTSKIRGINIEIILFSLLPPVFLEKDVNSWKAFEEPLSSNFVACFAPWNQLHTPVAVTYFPFSLSDLCTRKLSGPPAGTSVGQIRKQNQN